MELNVSYASQRSTKKTYFYNDKSSFFNLLYYKITTLLYFCPDTLSLNLSRKTHLDYHCKSVDIMEIGIAHSNDGISLIS